MKGQNYNLLQNIQEHWSLKLNEYIQFHHVKDTFQMSFCVTLDTLSRLVHFNLTRNRVMTNKITFKMNLVDSHTYLICNREETVDHALHDKKSD